MQNWISGVKIIEHHKLLAEDSDKNTTAIIVDDPLNPNEPLVIPLALKGVMRYFLYRNSKESEYEDESIPQIDTRREAPVWDTSDTSFAEQEDTINDFRGEVISSENITRGRRIINPLSTSKYHAVDFTETFIIRLTLRSM